MKPTLNAPVGPAKDGFGVAPVPASNDLKTIRAEAEGCRACPLWRGATCTVFGEGPSRAKVMLIGEQPGDQEDRAGHPFVGPAGKLLNRAIEAAGLQRDTFYVTNAVKHFKWTAQGESGGSMPSLQHARWLHVDPGCRRKSGRSNPN